MEGGSGQEDVEKRKNGVGDEKDVLGDREGKIEILPFLFWIETVDEFME